MDDNKKFWDRTAKIYSLIQEGSNRRMYQEVIAHCKKYIRKDKKVLELACGTGEMTYDLCEYAEFWEATDFSENMIREARKRKPSCASFSIQDACNLPYSDHSYDVVLIANALHIVPDPDRVLKEISRVLAPGGILLAPTFVYEGKVNKFRMWITTKAGFKTFHKWNLKELTDFIEQYDFEKLECRVIDADPIPEAFVSFKKEKRR